MKLVSLIIAVVSLIGTSAFTNGEVLDSGESGFRVQHQVQVNASQAATFKAFSQIGTWWSSAHTWSGDSQNLSMDVRPGGLFVEKLPEGGFVEHMRIVYAAPGKMIRLKGELGPLQEMAVMGSMSVQFDQAASADKTLVLVKYEISGYSPAGLKALAPLVDSVIAEQFDRLKKRIEDPDFK